LADDSGSRQGKRRVWGGRANVRAVVFRAAIVAIRHNAVMRAFYERLLAAGKPRRYRPPDTLLSFLQSL